MFFPLVMYGCESWTVNKSEHQRNGTFELVLEKTLESPLDRRRSNLSVLKEINFKYLFIGRTNDEVEAPLLWPPDAKSWLTGKDPEAGED